MDKKNEMPSSNLPYGCAAVAMIGGFMALAVSDYKLTFVMSALGLLNFMIGRALDKNKTKTKSKKS